MTLKPAPGKEGYWLGNIKGELCFRETFSLQSTFRLLLKPIDVSLCQVSLLFSALYPLKNQIRFSRVQIYNLFSFKQEI